MGKGRKRSDLAMKLALNDFGSWVHSMETPGISRTQIRPENVRGTIPKEIVGTFYRNGPALFQHGDIPVKLLDGDGFVVCVEIDNDQNVWFHGKFVETDELREELKAGTSLFRGCFGTKSSMFMRNYGIPRFKNCANTSILPVGQDRLFALWEGGKPYEMDQRSLRTIGGTNLNGALKRNDSFSAHPCVDPDDGHILNIGVNMNENYAQGPFKPHRLILWEFDDNMELISKQRIPLKLPYVIFHDFSITPNYAILPQSPLSMSMLRIMAGAGVADAVSELDDFLYIYVVKRQKERTNSPPKSPQVAIFRTKKNFTYHMINSFEDENGEKLVFDFLASPKYLPLEHQSEKQNLALEPISGVGDDFREVTLNKAHRVVMNLANIKFDGHTVYDVESDQCMYGSRHKYEAVEMPVVNPHFTGKNYQYCYAVDMCNMFDDLNRGWGGLVKIDMSGNGQHVKFKHPNHRLFYGDPVFIPKTSSPVPNQEDHGWLMTHVFNPVDCVSSVFIVDARKEMELICEITLNQNIPLGFHTQWVPRSRL